MICIRITIGIGPSGALLHTIGIGTIIGIGIGVRQWECTIKEIRRFFLNKLIMILSKIFSKMICIIFYRKMEFLDLLGIDKIYGDILREVPEKMPSLVYLNLQQCNQVSVVVWQKLFFLLSLFEAFSVLQTIQYINTLASAVANPENRLKSG